MKNEQLLLTVAKLETYAANITGTCPGLDTVIAHLKTQIEPSFYEQACLDRELKMRLALINANNRREE